MNMSKMMTLGVRLGLGFGMVLVLLVAIIAMAITRLENLNAGTEKIVTKDWIKAENAMMIDTYARANARRTMELFLATDKAQVARIKERIESNKASITAALERLDSLVVLPDGKALLAKIKEGRASYVVSFTRLQQLLDEGRRDDALRLLNTETLPLLDTLQAHIKDLVALQTKVMEASATEARQNYESARSMMLGLGIAAAAIGLLFAVFLTRSIVRQLGGEPEYVATIARSVADGDLTIAVETRAHDKSSVLFAMKTMVDKLSQVVAEVNGNAAALAAASEQVSATAQSLSQASSEQAAGVEETSASIEQMTASIAQNTENAKVTDGMATKAAQEATEGGDAVKATVSAMNQIAKKIVIIDDIAYQTNLLALNAAIEAARAGEHGKGFAVVAAEVRKLAERSQVAAQEIGEVATSSVELAEKAGKLLDEMVPNIKKTSDLVQEITAASEEQSSGVGQINSAVGQLSQTTQQNASSSEELAATAEEMSGQAEQLQQLMSFFKLAGASGTPARAKVTSLAHKAHAKPAPKKTESVRVAHNLALAAEGELDEAQFTRF
jgi:methyl-accepting chemotaxis protein